VGQAQGRDIHQHPGGHPAGAQVLFQFRVVVDQNGPLGAQGHVPVRFYVDGSVNFPYLLCLSGVAASGPLFACVPIGVGVGKLKLSAPAPFYAGQFLRRSQPAATLPMALPPWRFCRV
jgi:hypothetical protein